MNDSHLQNYHFYLDWKFKKEKVQKDKELNKKLQKYVYLKMIQTFNISPTKSNLWRKSSSFKKRHNSSAT
jgi:hypothetical protein